MLCRAAHASGTRLALDVDYAVALDEAGIGSGTGAALRLGQRFDLPLLSLTPEVGGSYHAFAGAREASIFSGFLGGRLGFGVGLEPSVFAHFGLAKLNATRARSGSSRGDGGPAFDVGLALALTLLPYLDVGAHLTYANLFLDDGENFDWLQTGLHAALEF